MSASSRSASASFTVDFRRPPVKIGCEICGVKFQTARDPDEGIPNSYGTYQYPETYVIDRNGKVVQKVIGSRNWMDPDNISSIQSL